MRNKNNKMYDIILNKIKQNNKVTEVYLAQKYEVHERTIRRYIKDLKDNNIIKLSIEGKNRQWIIIEKQ